ncbi:hypothetical protein VTN49DRAFT_4694 [Thermomyces lanuginosus]|uniref:uncharacterized protein n=1 Tax=Thermomyces lanuginosus TaxID=5541 RepID=UPI0037427A38
MSPSLRMGSWFNLSSFLSLLCFFFPRSVAGQQEKASETADRNDFAVQIAGIVSSYIIFDALIVLLILLVGRRLRRAAQTSNYTLDVVMLQPITTKGVASSTTDPSPISGVTGSTPDTEKPRGGGWRSMSWSSLGKGSSRGGPASPNSSVATIDETVVEADRRRAQEDLEKLYAAVMDHEAQKEAAAVAGLSPSSASSISPVSPGSPPPLPQNPKGSLPGFQRTPLSPLQEVATPPPSGNSLKARANQRLSKLSSGLAIFSPSLSSSAKSSPKTPRHPRTPSVRNLPISPPVQVVTGAAAANLMESSRSPAFSDQPPLTPRTYNPGPPPAPPVPEVNDQITNSTEHKQTRKPAPLDLRTATVTTTAANPSGTLPFRQQYSSSGMPQSAPPTKTTVLERPAHLHGSGPRTGVPTPYSPYMPFTPVTPITPSKMVTKKEKRKKDREDALRVLHEDDLVKSDEELWGL